MKRYAKSIKRRFIVTKTMGLAIINLCLIVLLFLSASLSSVESTYAYNSGDENSAHQWIIKKAIEYLKQKGKEVAIKYPLESYLPWLYWGVWYADNNEINCMWYVDKDKPWFAGGCDAIHHYGKVDDINFYKAGLPTGGITVAHPGGFAAPFYAGVLYDQAVKFWPGGIQPNLSDLPGRDAGYITIPISGAYTDLMNTYVGGLPFCQKYVALETGIDLVPLASCPKWPSWAATDKTAPIYDRFKKSEESVENAMKYLGWATHMVEDMTVPVHALNEVSEDHQWYEDRVDDWIKDGSFNHLPVSPNGSYQYKPCNLCTEGNFWYPVSQDYFNLNWTVEQFANEGGRVAIETNNGTAILPSYDEYKDKYEIKWVKSIAERGVDTAIKLVAASLEKYLAEISLRPDPFEENDTYFTAKDIAPGVYYNLTCDTPSDEDWYKIRVEKDYSDLVIDISYNKSFGILTAHVASIYSDWAGVPKSTSYGMRIEMKGIKAGDYWLHVYPFDQVPFRYNMSITLGIGSLPPDSYEENDSPDTAKGFFHGCDFTGTLNIDKAGDDDYYYLDVVDVFPGERLEAEIMFDPTQGELQLFLDGVEATDAVLESSNSKKLSISKCRSGVPSIVRITGAINWYSMCMNRYYSDPACLPVKVSGGAYFYPETTTYRASFSMDITGPSSPSGWLKYYYTRTRMNFVSTGITNVSKSGSTATISGTGTMNGASGYTFMATVSDGTPDSFGITIKKPDGSLYYSAGSGAISGGDLIISLL